MAKTNIYDWDTTASNNTDVGGIPILGTSPVGGFDDALRELMAQVKAFQLQPALDIASATTTAIGGVASVNVRITGSNTITGFGTIDAGTFRRVRFAASLTLTHNATSLILPGASNITTAAGDVGEFISEGSGNWRCVSYTKANGAGVYERAWELIRTNVAVTASAWTFADLGIYRAIRISGRVKPGNDNVTLRMNVSTNNGVSYDSNVANYSNVYSTVSGTTAAHGTDTASGTWFITPTGVGNASGRFASFELIIHEFNQAAWSSFEGRGTLFGSDGVHKRFEMAGAHVTSVALNAIQIVFSSGTFDGTITLEGIRG